MLIGRLIKDAKASPGRQNFLSYNLQPEEEIKKNSSFSVYNFLCRNYSINF